MLQYDKEKENHKAMKIATCLGNSNTVQLEWHFLCIKRPKFHQQWPVSNGDNFIFPLIFKYFVVTLPRHFVWHFMFISFFFFLVFHIPMEATGEKKKLST